MCDMLNMAMIHFYLPAPKSRRMYIKNPLLRLFVNIFGVLLLIALLLGISIYRAKSSWYRMRVDWKYKAIAQLAERTIDNEEIHAELGNLRTTQEKIGEHKVWFHEKVMLMKNGEWLTFEFRHGPPHLFLAKTSDGRWLYSTYHFCTNMGMLMADDAPDSIDAFKERYFVREFDGKSDVCLETTWVYKEDELDSEK
jgi:hypothetical protein